MNTENLNIAADCLRDNGFDEEAKAIESPYGQWIGQRISLYGPNYIWRGELVGVTPQTVTLADCYQVYETGDHSTTDSEGDRATDLMVFERAAICNAGVFAWS